MTSHKNLLADINVDDIVKKSIRASLPAQASKSGDVITSLQESFVAEPKSYSQVSEFVSQKTKEAHIQTYREYIESLNRTSAELDTADRHDVNAHHSEYASLKRDETFNLNATWLHELYFANCFDPQSEVYMDSIAYIKIQRDFGNFDDWQKDFVACGLAAGEGWAVCGYNIFLKKYVNTVVKGHSDSVMLGLYPIVVVDLWSHAYFRDYLNDKKSYLVSQMREINWNVVEQRVTRAESIAEVLK